MSCTCSWGYCIFTYHLTLELSIETTSTSVTATYTMHNMKIWRKLHVQIRHKDFWNNVKKSRSNFIKNSLLLIEIKMAGYLSPYSLIPHLRKLFILLINHIQGWSIPLLHTITLRLRFDDEFPWKYCVACELIICATQFFRYWWTMIMHLIWCKKASCIV